MPHLVANKPSIEQLWCKQIVYQTPCPLIPMIWSDWNVRLSQSWAYCVALAYNMEVESDIIDATNNLLNNTGCNWSTRLAVPGHGWSWTWRISPQCLWARGSKWRSYLDHQLSCCTTEKSALEFKGRKKRWSKLTTNIYIRTICLAVRYSRRNNPPISLTRGTAMELTSSTVRM